MPPRALVGVDARSVRRARRSDSAFKRPPYRAARLVPRDRMARYVKVLFGMPGAAAPPTEYRKLSLQTAKGSVSFAAIRRMP